MGFIRVSNENESPLTGVAVEAYDPTTGRIQQVVQTDNSGIANFQAMPSNTQYRVRATRRSGQSGALSLNGAVNIDNRDAAGGFSQTAQQAAAAPFQLPDWFILRDEGGGTHRVEVDARELILIFQNLPQADPGGGQVWLSDT